MKIYNNYNLLEPFFSLTYHYEENVDSDTIWIAFTLQFCRPPGTICPGKIGN